MLREQQIDIRRRRAAEENFSIQNLGRNRVFSDYQITNPTTGGQYRVSIRGFDTGDNSCQCPDFRTNTLGTCKHIEAVLAALRDQTPVQLRNRKATFPHPEIYLDYGEQLQLGLHLPKHFSDQLSMLAEMFFDEHGFWKGGDRYQQLIERVEHVPEQVTIFSDAMEFMEREIERHEMAEWEVNTLRQLEAETPDLEDEENPLHGLLGVPLYQYQLRGALFLASRGRSILGDDMGLGKTVQTLAAHEILARKRGIERVLVVAPASVKYQWESEIQRMTGRSVQVIDGTTEQRRSQYRKPTFYRLINYDLAVRDLDELNAWEPDSIVLDEAQRIKNWEAKTTRAIKRLRSRYAIVLTGTPLENKLEELYSIVQFVDDRRLGPAFQFLHEHRKLDDNGKLLGYRNLDKIREKLEPIFLRRTREEVLTQLPARTDNTIYVEMADAQRKVYGEQQQSLARLLRKKYLSEVDRRRVLSCLTNLRMLCNSTFLVDHETHVSPKLDELADLLHDLLDSGPRKVVIFSQWEVMLHQAAELADKLKYRYTMLHGNIRGKARKKVLDDFRDDPEVRIFFSTDAGGTGLNLQSADTVINLEVPWNPAVLEQRIARVHRMGQHRPVQVFYLVTRDSIEERVLRTLERKKSLFEGIFSGTDDELAFDGGQQNFLDVMRELFEDEPAPQSPTASDEPGDASALVIETGVRFLEALAQFCATQKFEGATSEQLQRGTAALQHILSAMHSEDSDAE